MATLDALRFDNSYARLHPAFYQVVDPTPLTDPRLLAFNPAAAALIDLDAAAADHPDAARYLSGGLRLPGAEPIAAIYAGHQFGVWVPQLGDGRAILLGEVVNGQGARWDLQLKGAGPTAFSRMGDGRAVLRSTIREYLASEAMHGLGIPTTRALALVASSDPVYRETPETAATLIRMAPTHVRFGTFQLFASRGMTDRVRELADHVIAHHDPDLAEEPDRYGRWFGRAVDRTADMIAAWMAVGFSHGVMNTDNMSVLGLTLDYGPYGFMDGFDPGFICNHTDHAGRYAFDQQPGVALWNLARFAEALLELISVEEANAALERYQPRLLATYHTLMRAKLGLVSAGPEDPAHLQEMLDLMAEGRTDYTRWFRALAAVSADSTAAPEELRTMVAAPDRLDAWTVRHAARLARDGRPEAERRAAMAAVNPRFVLRNHLAQQAIERAQEGDLGPFHDLARILAAPFDEHPGFDRFAEAAPPWARDLVVSCSS